MTSGARNYNLDNKVAGLIEQDSYPVQLVTVAAGAYASNGAFGVGAASTGNLDPQLLTKSTISYQRVGKMVHVSGNIMLDKTAAVSAVADELLLIKKPVATGFQRETFGAGLPAPPTPTRITAEIIDSDGTMLQDDTFYGVRILADGSIALISRLITAISQEDVPLTPALITTGFAGSGTRYIRFQGSYLL